MTKYLFDVHLSDGTFAKPFAICANNLKKALRLLSFEALAYFKSDVSNEFPVHWYVSDIYFTISDNGRFILRTLNYDYRGVAK